MKTLTELITETCDAYKAAPALRRAALGLDLRALKTLGSIAGSRAAAIPPTDLHEVTKWGIGWDLSRYPELRDLAAGRRAAQA
jgi:hypothetical protein